MAGHCLWLKTFYLGFLDDKKEKKISKLKWISKKLLLLKNVRFII